MTTENVSANVKGMGSIIHEAGVAFRVWAPHAEQVSVIGNFNNWNPEDHLMEQEGNGYWYLNIEQAKAGDEYQYWITNGDFQAGRIDPYARKVTNSSGNSVIYDTSFDWGDDNFEFSSLNELVIYEMHVGTFNRTRKTGPGRFFEATKRFKHLKRLGVNAIEIMPVAEFAGDWSWGYNPAHIFAVEEAYGGPDGFKEMIKAAHAEGIAIIADVVYNHFGPSDLDLWQFDGWSENGKGGIYFYNDWRSSTPWGDTRPDYGRGEVRQYIRDNAMMWLDEYHVDGLRYDMTAYIRKVNGIDESDIPEGWGLLQWINGEIASKYPRKILIAEDLQGNEYLTRRVEEQGAGFSTQWDGFFVHPVRNAVQQLNDADRNMWEVSNSLQHRYNLDAFQRVVYSESHDEIANGKARVPEEIDPDDPENYFAQKRSVLAAALALTAPGIPMIMQGQEFLEDGWFDDEDPLDWERWHEFKGITRLYQDLISLRLNVYGKSKGLTGQNIKVHHVNDEDKVIAYHRWYDGGPGDDVVVVMNFANRTWDHYEIGVPDPGEWKLLFNSDWTGYSDEFNDFPVSSITASTTARDGLGATAEISLGAYSILIYGRVE
ncbi:1,4-alpha-glucan branching enzyme GlgB [Polystyrenella longa]|uniref:1,4-alpha-glucan branching enzyme n=1 Tax=Polystyrenella longa TaxID=2528007 RepID=A0A518CK87_9PLAN|nr:alpha-amylase family glycosyl hydrolase [Polystyrenella longa]QDU79630.1 1,4-alpha-glucan branching enzyme GlgB [Polystyrenella longa]